MAPEKLENPHSCPIEEDARFQELSWRCERLGWIIMAMLVAAALFGLFGGPASMVESADATGRVHISYERFQRNLTPAEMQIAVDAQNNPIIDLVVDAAFSRAFELRSISPTPLESLSHDEGVLFRFAVSAENQAPVRIVFVAVPGEIGRFSGAIGLLGEGPSAINIFVHP